MVTLRQRLLESCDDALELEHRSRLEHTTEYDHVEDLVIAHLHTLLRSGNLVDVDILAVRLVLDQSWVVNQDTALLDTRSELVE